ncbi:hypothetical protein B7494_g5585 [Chlorociboria aeruginascens]|nr:hypothetical protein B7494_g5585 [Chlorociboria aeruginascens]
MLQTRPSSASGILQSTSQSHGHQYHPNPSHVPRNSFHGISNSMGSYRGSGSMAPIAPYAFTSTPGLAMPAQRMENGPIRQVQRTSSAPIIPTAQAESPSSASRSRYPAAPSVSTTSSVSSSDLSALSPVSGIKDGSTLSNTARVANAGPRPQSTVITSASGPNLAPPVTASPGKATPDRYRRPGNRRADSSTVSTSSIPNVVQFYGNAQQLPVANTTSTFNLQMPQFSPSSGTPGVTADDMQLNRHTPQDQAKRYRRRSIHTIDAGDYAVNPVPSTGFPQQGPNQVNNDNSQVNQHPLRSSPIVTVRPATSHGRNDSTDSTNSLHSRPSSASKRELMPTSNPAPTTNLAAEATSLRHDLPKLVNIPPRASSSDAAKRINNPSPLSKPMTMSPESPASKDSFASAVNAALQSPSKPTYAQVANGASPISPAAQQLAALNEKESKKTKTSRLRRAFSFGSAAELRRASAENNAANNASGASAAAVDRSKLRKERYQDEREAEQARIAQQQEAGGIGSGIYSGQGNFFTGSTDNLSISSTASSASVMIRKMGKGMKKSTRSLVGLFRPKSVIGVPAADAAVPEASQAQVSMVTVEAEREKVNVNASPLDQAGGGTGYPKLDQNSVEAANTTSAINERLGSSGTENSSARRSIVGGEKERAEVLAAVKKGILKRSGTDSGNSSPVIRPLDTKTPSFNLPQIPHVNESPNSSAPSTPNEDQQGHRRTGSVTLGGEDYFMSALRFRGESKSVPGTPQGSVSKRNATFSPRIQFHDTWPSVRSIMTGCNEGPAPVAVPIPETNGDSTYMRKKLHGRAFYESIGSPKFVLAPMVDQSEFAWRMLSRSFMTPTSNKSLLAYTPMLHARMFIETAKFRDTHLQPLRTSLLSHPSPSDPPTLESSLYLDGNPSFDRPLFVQFCANNPVDFLSAAKYVSPFCDAVDLNLGCPQGIARKGKYGAFLQEHQDLIYDLINTLHKNLDIPVTAKLRILETREKTLEYVMKVVEAGASVITVHGRQREQKGHKTGMADWGVIKWLRERVPREIVMFANGNILNREDIDACIAETGVDGVMSAEGNLYDPAIFSEPPEIGHEGREYWRGKDGKGGWRMDAAMRRYMDIIHKYVLETAIPERKPLYLPSDPVEVPKDGVEEGGGEEEGPPRKKQKQEKREKVANPNLLAMQAHLFHLLRPLVSKHHPIRDALAKCRAGDIAAVENVLQMVENAVKEGIKEYKETDGKRYEEEVERLDEEIAKRGEMADGEYESSVEAVKRCRRPWWVVQPYVRPLPMEALKKGSLTLSKKEMRKIEEKQREKNGNKPGHVELETAGNGERREEVMEIPKEGLVCG